MCRKIGILLFLLTGACQLFGGSGVLYSNPSLYHVTHTVCSYNINITTMTGLELNIPLPENWPDCKVSNLKVTAADPIFLHNTEGPGQLYRIAFNKFGKPVKNTLVSLVLEYDVELSQVDIDFDELVKRDFPDYEENAEYKYYTENYEELSPDDPQVRVVLDELLKQSNGNSVLYAKAAYDWVGKNIEYGTPPGSIRPCFEQKKADCGGFAAIFVMLCRGVGIPSRFIAGCWAGGFNGWHCWAEFYLPEVGWVPIDHSPAGGFGYLSNNHLPLVKAGSMKFDANIGSKECGFVQPGYWFFWLAGGSEGSSIVTEFMVDSFAYKASPPVTDQKEFASANAKALKAIEQNNYNLAIQIYLKILESEACTDSMRGNIEYRLAKCYLVRGQKVKAMSILMQISNEQQGTYLKRKVENLSRTVRSRIMQTK